MSIVRYTNKERRAMLEAIIDSAEYRRSVKDNEVTLNDDDVDMIVNNHRERAFKFFEVDNRISAEEEKEKISKALLEHKKKNKDEGTIITLCLDQKQSVEDAVKNQYLVIDALRKANYKWMVEPYCVFEYWSKDNTNPNKLKWNPHIHIAVRRIGKESKIRTNLTAKLKRLPTVYRFDVKNMLFTSAIDYCEGLKRADKIEAVNADKITRAKHLVSNNITI